MIDKKFKIEKEIWIHTGLGSWENQKKLLYCYDSKNYYLWTYFDKSFIKYESQTYKELEKFYDQ